MNRFSFFILVASFFVIPSCDAQLLRKNIAISAHNKPVSEVLEMISKQGEFVFGYNSDRISGDSIVTFFVKSGSVREILDALLSRKYSYKEKGNYIIIHDAPKEKNYQITGQVLDRETGKEVDYASVFSKKQLVSDLTDDSGFFKFRFRESNFPMLLNVSKVGYADTSFIINSETEPEIRVFISPKAIDLDTLFIRKSKENNSWLARLFVSSRLRAQSRNLNDFFVSLPFQASLTPGLSTHGRLSTQITNKFSLNIYGGYTAGVNGVEIGGLFNISKKDARYLQMATTFNAVTGKFTGVQIGGIYNQILDSLKGLQLSGLAGFVKGDIAGAQFAAGGNVATRNMSGTQISALINITGGRMNGLQLSGVNYAKDLKGVQIGLINLADTSSGYSIGLFNIVKRGMGSVSIFTSELLPWNLAWKSGNKKLYTIFTIGSSFDHEQKTYIFGFGFGREFILNDRFRANAELSGQNIYLRIWKNNQIIYRFYPGLNVKLNKHFSFNAGPSLSVFYNKEEGKMPTYKSFINRGFPRFDLGQNGTVWLGWQIGLSWNYNRL